MKKRRELILKLVGSGVRFRLGFIEFTHISRSNKGTHRLPCVVIHKMKQLFTLVGQSEGGRFTTVRSDAVVCTLNVHTFPSPGSCVLLEHLSFLFLFLFKGRRIFVVS